MPLQVAAALGGDAIGGVALDVSPVVGQVDNALADTGYFSEAAVLAVESGDSGTTAFGAMKRQSHGRSVVQLEARADLPPPAGASVAPRMEWRLDTEARRKLYGMGNRPW